MLCCVSLFLIYVRKQDTETTAAHSKNTIELLKGRKIIFADFSSIQDHKQVVLRYTCVIHFYMLMLAHAYNIVINHIFRALDHVKNVVYGLNTTDKKFYQC